MKFDKNVIEPFQMIHYCNKFCVTSSRKEVEKQMNEKNLMENVAVRGDMLILEGLNVSSSSRAFAILFSVSIFIMVSHICLLVLIFSSRSLHQPMDLLLCIMMNSDAFGAAVIDPQLLPILRLSPSAPYFYYLEQQPFRLLLFICMEAPHTLFSRSWPSICNLQPIMTQTMVVKLGFGLPPAADPGGPQPPPRSWTRPIFVQAVLWKRPGERLLRFTFRQDWDNTRILEEPPAGSARGPVKGSSRSDWLLTGKLFRVLCFQPFTLLGFTVFHLKCVIFAAGRCHQGSVWFCLEWWVGFAGPQTFTAESHCRLSQSPSGVCTVTWASWGGCIQGPEPFCVCRFLCFKKLIFLQRLHFHSKALVLPPLWESSEFKSQNHSDLPPEDDKGTKWVGNIPGINYKTYDQSKSQSAGEWEQKHSFCNMSDVFGASLSLSLCLPLILKF